MFVRDDAAKLRHPDNSKKIKYYYHAFPGGTVRGKTDNEEAYISFNDPGFKDSEKAKI